MSPTGTVAKARRHGSLFFRPAEFIAPVVDEGAFRRAMEPFDQDEEDRVPVEGEEVRPEEVLRAPDVCEVRDEGSLVTRAPTQPSEENQRDHFARQHEPYADWCQACVAGRRRGIQHRKNKRPGKRW